MGKTDETEREKNTNLMAEMLATRWENWQILSMDSLTQLIYGSRLSGLTFSSFSALAAFVFPSQWSPLDQMFKGVETH